MWILFSAFVVICIFDQITFGFEPFEWMEP